MKKRAAGILLYRRTPRLGVLVAHPGGPFYARKDDGCWSIVKGEYEEDEDAYEAARREFKEETGHDAPGGGEELTPVTLPTGKHVRVWMMEGDLDPSTIVSNETSIEWPPRSGRQMRIPEIDRAEWFSPEDAKRKLWSAQAPFIDELVKRLEDEGKEE